MSNETVTYSLEAVLTRIEEKIDVSPQYIGVRSYYGIHEQAK